MNRVTVFRGSNSALRIFVDLTSHHVLLQSEQYMAFSNTKGTKTDGLELDIYLLDY